MRTEKGWSQEHLAEASGISERTIRRVESGAATPSLQTLQTLANGFWVDVSQFTALLREVPRSQAVTQVQEILNGEQFFNALAGAHFLSTRIAEPQDPGAADLIRDLLSETETAEIWGDIPPVSRFDSARNVTDTISRLREVGWFVAVARSRRTMQVGDAELPSAVVATLVIDEERRLGSSASEAAQQGVAADGAKPRRA